MKRHHGGSGLEGLVLVEAFNALQQTPALGGTVLKDAAVVVAAAVVAAVVVAAVVAAGAQKLFVGNIER